MRSISRISVLTLFALAGCAHSPQPTAQAVAPEERPKPPDTPAPVVAEVDPAAELAAALRGTTLLFDFDSALLKPASMAALQRVAQLVRKHHPVLVKIEGNCDERGTEEYNLHLGQRRAEAARKYLVALGVSPQQLDTISYGALRPANPGHSEEAWAQNRRDELHASR